MMQAGVCLRQDTETTLPELTEQHRIRQKEEELSGLESVHMAESETECAAPRLDTLEPECVTAHNGVSDGHNTHTSLIKTETELGSTHTGNLIKTESLDSTELGYVTHLHPEQIKTEADDGGYLQTEHISDSQGVQCVKMKSDHEWVKNCFSGISGLSSNLRIQRGDLKCHQVSHSGVKPYKCLECGKYFSQRSSLNVHQRIHTGEKPYKCTLCEKCFSQRSSLNVHQRTHTGEKPYKCTLCGKCFSHSSDLKCHQVSHSGVKPYKCLECGKYFSQRGYLNVHQRTHTGEKPYKCTWCGKCFSRKYIFIVHQRMHTGEKPFKCTLCGKCFSQSCDLKSHQVVHSGAKPYKCLQCGKCFSKKSSLNVHQRIHTCTSSGLNTLEPECVTAHSGVSDGRNTHTSLIKTETDLGSTHIRDLFKTESLDSTELGYGTHLHPDKIKTEADDGGYLKAEHISDLQNIKCVEMKSDLKCMKKCFVVICRLNGHHRIHRGEEPYKCTWCGKCFTLKSSLNTHQRIHTGEKPYKCTLCGKCFSQSSVLKSHQVVHSGAKPYKCLQCGRCFSRSSNLNRHKVIHSGVKPHKCLQCGKSFSQRSSLNVHQRIHMCAPPGLNTLEPECVTAHSGVSDVHQTHTSLIKSETDLGSTHTGDLIKTENLDSTELGYVSHLHPDKIKTEADDGGYLKAEHISDSQGTKCN